MRTFKEIYTTLSAIDVTAKIEKKNGLSYLSWAHAHDILSKNTESSNYTVRYFDGKPYFFDTNLGYMVATQIEVEGYTREMHLPVMDGANKSQKHESYQYDTKFGKKTVLPATMFDINTAIMRCLVKNIALFGLGINLYAGEDLPLTDVSETKTEPQPKEALNQEKSIQSFESEKPKVTILEIKKIIDNTKTAIEYASYIALYLPHIKQEQELRDAHMKKYSELVKQGIIAK